MGYKKVFSLLTIQLMLPLSTMTKEAYKATYGIDLNDIDFEKVSLIQKEGSKEKYYVDEVKITEDGVDIYAGGNILSIGESSVSVTENAYSVVNAKPIYIHPISLVKTSADLNYSLACLIFNNDPEPFTFSTFATYLDDLATSLSKEIQILLTGYYKNNTNSGIVSYMFVNRREGANGLGIAGYDQISETIKALVSGVTYSSVFGSDITFVDGVNKIN